MSGDVIGCALDMDQRVIAFSFNGRFVNQCPLVQAFANEKVFSLNFL